MITIIFSILSLLIGAGIGWYFGKQSSSSNRRFGTTKGKSLSDDPMTHHDKNNPK